MQRAADVVAECGADPSVICRNVVDATGIGWLGRLLEWALRTPLQVAFIVAAAIGATWLVGLVIRRVTSGVARVQERVPGEIVRAEQRRSALSSALRSVAVGAIWSVAVITIIGALGVNLGAFVAVATVIGGAIGFGAQQVVRDLIAGMYVVAEDQYGVGDIIDVGFASGTVEKVSLRSVKLRDIEGRLWHVPHGNVQRVANLSQEWAQSLIDVPISLEADVTRVIPVLQDVVDAAVAAPSLDGRVLDPPQVLGVQSVLDDRIVLRVVVRTQPAAQWEVGRAVWTAVLAARADGRLPAHTPLLTPRTSP